MSVWCAWRAFLNFLLIEYMPHSIDLEIKAALYSKTQFLIKGSDNWKTLDLNEVIEMTDGRTTPHSCQLDGRNRDILPLWRTHVELLLVAGAQHRIP